MGWQFGSGCRFCSAETNELFFPSFSSLKPPKYNHRNPGKKSSSRGDRGIGWQTNQREDLRFLLCRADKCAHSQRYQKHTVLTSAAIFFCPGATCSVKNIIYNQIIFVQASEWLGKIEVRKPLESSNLVMLPHQIPFPAFKPIGRAIHGPHVHRGSNGPSIIWNNNEHHACLPLLLLALPGSCSWFCFSTLVTLPLWCAIISGMLALFSIYKI